MKANPVQFRPPATAGSAAPAKTAMSGTFPARAASPSPAPAKFGSGFYGNPSHASSIRNALSKQADSGAGRVTIAPSKLTKQASVPAGLGSGRYPPTKGGAGAGAGAGPMSPGRQTPASRAGGEECATCGVALSPEEACVQALGQKFHTHHFLCAQCNCQLAGQRFGSLNGQALCEKCFAAAQAPPQRSCHACGRPCQDTAFEIAGRFYHGECLRCGDCKKSLVGLPIAERGDRLLCEPCFDAAAPRQLCALCSKVLTEPGIEALGKEWHRACFACTKCSKQLDPGSQFATKDGRIYCIPCYGDLFAKKCAHCTKPIVSKEYLTNDRNGLNYHVDCAGGAGLAVRR